MLFSFAAEADETTRKYIKYLQHLPSKTKKYRFFKLVLPPVQTVDKELRNLYLRTKTEIETNTNKKHIIHLMRLYRATDHLDLLKKIKPHPLSITLAQAAMESAWGTSRFFIEANNIFGMWSKSKHTKNTIKAGEIRKNGRQIFLQRYKTLTDSVRAYYKTIATNDAYSDFRDARYRSDDPFEIVAHLDNYSEKKDLYPIELIKIILHNNLTRYDSNESLPHFSTVPQMGH